jgi:hypothetical protein
MTWKGPTLRLKNFSYLADRAKEKLLMFHWEAPFMGSSTDPPTSATRPDPGPARERTPNSLDEDSWLALSSGG